mgnify:FL=1
MKKYITYFLMAAALIGGATACNEDDLTKESSFDNMTPYLSLIHISEPTRH